MTEVAEFVTSHAKPYDPGADTYRRPPFAAPVKAGKNSAVYNAHSYHTKVPPRGIVPYIQHYTEPADLVLDPFYGSGMTGVFKQVDECWYLRGEAMLGGDVFDVMSDAGAIAWLTAVLGKPQTIGELIPEWQKITAHAGGTGPGRLESLLEENFWLDKRTGRWRVPTEADRARMSAQDSLKDEAHLRVVRRFLSGQLPQRPSPTELAAWVQFCYSHQAYAEAVRLLALLDPAKIDPR